VVSTYVSRIFDIRTSNCQQWRFAYALSTRYDNIIVISKSRVIKYNKLLCNYCAIALFLNSILFYLEQNNSHYFYPYKIITFYYPLLRSRYSGHYRFVVFKINYNTFELIFTLSIKIITRRSSKIKKNVF